MIYTSCLGRTPTVFVSSTCYDLSQVRVNIKAFIEQKLGYEALLSEFNSFPLETNLGTVDNCLRVVQERADIFVLIVGGRYGCINDTGKSITNLEYLQAQAKGVPIYAFIDKAIINTLPLWRDNPTANFNSVVDSPKLFEFVEILQGKDSVWTYSFENAQDVEQSLQKQFGYLFYDCLKLRCQIKSKKLSPKATALRGESFKLAVEKPAGWEYKLFGLILKDELVSLRDLRRDLKYGISFGNSKELLEGSAICSWIQLKIKEILRAIEVLNSLIYKALPEAFGAPDEPGDIDYIIYSAEKMASVYKNIIDWALDFKLIIVPDDWYRLVEIVSKLSDLPLVDIEDFCTQYNQEMLKIPTVINENQEPITLNATLTLNEPNLDQYNQEMERLSKKYGLGLIRHD